MALTILAFLGLLLS